MKARTFITLLAIIPIFLASCSLRNSPRQQNSPFPDRDSEDFRSRRGSESRDNSRDSSRDSSRDDFRDDSRDNESRNDSRDSRDDSRDDSRNNDEFRRFRNHDCR